jgi:transposase-like protein
MISRHVFIKPNYGETIFSLLSREHLLSGRTSPLISLKEITGHRGYRPLSSLPSSLTTICQNLNLATTPEDIVINNTLFNLYRPFLNPKRRTFIIQAMLDSGAVKSRMGLLKSHCGAADQLAYCSECVEADIYRHGFAYWHREHMLVGVEMCHLHSVSITKIKMTNETFEARNLQLPGTQGSTDLWTDEQFEKLVFIARQISIVTNAERDFFINSNSYHPILKLKGLITKSNHIRIQAIQNRVLNWLKPLSNIGVYKQLFLALKVERNWVANLVAGREGLHHPLKHIILWAALETDFYSFIDTLQYSEQLCFDFNINSKKNLSVDEILDIYAKYGSATSTAKFLKCSVSTVLVLLQQSGISLKRKPKKLNSKLIEKILELSDNGYSTRQISIEVNISIPTVNRIKRSNGK